MFEDRFRLRPTHGFGHVFLIHEVTDRNAEPDIGEVHHDQRQHEVGDGYTNQPHQRQAVIAPAILMRSRVNADRECDQPGEDDRQEGDEDRQP
ncbi:hypothetical protein D9M72_562140 [compost metagenome]